MRLFILLSQVCLCCALLSQSLLAAAVRYEPGCIAKLYILEKRFAAAIPAAASEILRYDEVIDIEAVDKDETGQPNYLVESELGLLKMSENYAVEFEGYIQAEQNGLHTITVQTDDPVEVYIEGKLLCKSYWSACWDEKGEFRGNKIGETTSGRHNYGNPSVCPLVQSISGTAKLGADRWYHVVILSKQSWSAYRPYRLGDDRYPAWDKRFNTARGAHLRVWMARPNATQELMKFQLPVIE